MSIKGVLHEFEDVEYTKPAEAFRNAGHKLVHVGLKKGSTVHGKKEKTPVHIDKSVSEVTSDDFDALFIPGGYSPDKLRVEEDAVRFARDFMNSGKPVFAICHAAQLLITADVLRGRKVTGWKSIVQDIKNAGAEYIDADVVEDGNLISSRAPPDIPAFVKAALKKLT
ncbi:MAG: type 1 glutamine amidotransferase [Methanomicrobiales archaeon]|nr:type 1 glutamine amidotransferase [Methanomicrobiales archaeon]